MEERETYSGWERESREKRVVDEKESREKNIPIFGVRGRYGML